MDHGRNIKSEKDDSFQYRQKIGIILFLVYCIIYSGFIIINVSWPKLMELNILFGVNLAVIYGFSLIIIAIIFGLTYDIICTNIEKKSIKTERKNEL